jgi:hypothetical protein
MCTAIDKVCSFCGVVPLALDARIAPQQYPHSTICSGCMADIDRWLREAELLREVQLQEQLA